MKKTRLIIKNIGMIADEIITLDKPLILFYGEIRQGKSTILNAVRWVCGAKWPSDIIRHGQKEAKIELEFSGGSISRSWYRSTKTGETMAREIVFVRDGKPVARPAQAIQSLLNPFLLNQNHLAEMNEVDRKKFFIDLFAVDTTALDTEAFNAQRQAQELRAAIAAYGEIDLAPVETVDVAPLKTRLNNIRAEHAKDIQATERRNEINRTHNLEVSSKEHNRDLLKQKIDYYETALARAKEERGALVEWLSENEYNPILPMPVAPDTTDLESEIQRTAANNVRAEQYARNKATAARRDAQRKELTALESRQREIKAQKAAKLASITDESGIAGLKFDDEGNFTYRGTTASMLSTSEIMELSSVLSALYPEGFGLDLIDRGESLGASIFEFIERAKANDSTILATIVGEKPAKTPPEVGVFVVKDGKLTEGNLL